MSDNPSAPTVTVYWRHCCPFCGSLRRRLRPLGVAATAVNIWQDPDAAATARVVAGGNETVPTGIVAGEALVNPIGPQALDAVRPLAHLVGVAGRRPGPRAAQVKRPRTGDDDRGGVGR